jgi:hypothetical protein
MIISGTAGDDNLTGTAGDDTIDALDGADTVNAGAGNDTIFGGSGNDSLQGGLGNDVIHGGDGNDSIDGGGGADTLLGESGNDFFTNFGFWAAQSGDGGAGNDRFWAYLQSNSTITTGADSDTIQLFNVFGQHKLVVTDFAAGSGGDVLDINSVLSNLIGWDGSTNPFATGFLRLVQNGSDTDLQWDPDSATGGVVWTTFVTLQNVTASSLTAANFLPGYLPDASAPPMITSNGGGGTASVSIGENSTGVTTVTAIDPDAGQTLSYSISGGADADKFTIISDTGVLSFVTAPNFELPKDAGANNVYDVTVQVSLLACRTWSLTPRAPAAACRFVNCESAVGLVGLRRMAITAAAGTTSCRISSRFGVTCTFKLVTPVRLPPGRFRVPTSPIAIGSAPISKIIGIVVVADFAASAAGAPPGATITATGRPARSAASAGSLLCWPSAQRNSIATF